MKSLTERKEWQALLLHRDMMISCHMRDCFDKDPNRFARFSFGFDEIFFDFSRNRITIETLSLLCQLALVAELPTKIDALFAGVSLNHTESRPALHTALRDQSGRPLLVDGENIMPKIAASHEKMQDFIAQIHTQKWKGITGKPIKHIINIGVGGSHHGAQLGVDALKAFAVTDMHFHFISSIDKVHVDDILQQIDPETSLFIISSKSFTTLETSTNAHFVRDWLQEKLGKQAILQHMIAVTAEAEKALAFGIPADHIFPIWDWVGGRYSVWSAIGLPLALMIGNDHWTDFLRGAAAMDQHFRSAPLTENMPVLLALLGIWYINFFNASAHAVVPYAHRLRYLIPHLRQVDMESNGKSMTVDEQLIDYVTGIAIFGEEGSSGQHSYHQLLHQGQPFIPVDFILVGKATDGMNDDHHQDMLIASGLSQAQALMRGKTYDEAYRTLIDAHCSLDTAKWLAYHQMVSGNKPSNVLFLDRLSPKNLGALLALYEHKIFVQGAIWQINSFDQWGVELGKQLLPHIMDRLDQTNNNEPLDSATEGLIRHYQKIKGKIS